jgi:oxaloacetate decarboxylase gamma subunit
MIVGMITVFAVLLIIIFLSQLLIALVNRMAPEEEKPGKAVASPAIPQDVMEVIRKTVEQITGGKGSVANVSKI